MNPRARAAPLRMRPRLLVPPDPARPHAYARLEEALGGRLARLLLGALVGDHRLSPRDLG